MEFFPQLTTGTLAQYPLRKSIETRSVINACPDGSRVLLYDVSASGIRWEMSYQGLSGEETASLFSLFNAVEGRLDCFAWLDPAGNLLRHSEDFGAPAWTRDPLLQLTNGRLDPNGTTSATRLVNAAQIVQALSQQITGLGRFTYTFSIYSRGDEPVSAVVRAHTSSVQHEQSLSVDATWRRNEFVFRLGAPEEQVTFSVDIPPGASIELFGAQVEPQPSAGLYKRTNVRGGVHTNTRFDQDELLSTAVGPDDYAVTVRLFVTPNE